jgi:asparagine synthase (glutamine-hydrolysing)
MPGLVGIISRQQSADCDRQLKTMLASMHYEDFYSTGAYSNPELSVYIAWTCHPRSFCDCLPAANQAKDIILFFVGEVFEDKNQFVGSKNENGENNLERLIRMYEDCREKFFEKLNGWFSGLLIDTRLRKVFLFNDRYGMHRVFMHENKNGIYFSSEAKALLAVLPDTRAFDPKGLGEFLTCGTTLGSNSLYENVSILPPASLWAFKNGECEKKNRYFTQQEWVGQGRLDEKKVSYNVVEAFGSFVKRYTRGPLAVGVSLTGGLDSRMIMACLDTRDGKFPCYTFGSMYRDTFDVQTAREVARACGQPHHVLVLGEQFLRDFPSYLEKAVYISDGYIGLSGAAELFVNSLARNLAPVRLTGNYGGELLRGVRTFKCEIPRGSLVNPDFKQDLHEAKRTFQELEKKDPVTLTLFHQAPSQGYGRLTIERSQVILRTPFMDNDLVKLVYQALPHLLKGEKLCAAIISQYNPNLAKIPTDRGLLCSDSRLKSLVRQLYRKGLIKGEYLSNHGMPNWVAAISRYGFGGILERSFLGRDKFQHFRLWIQKYFASYIGDILIAGSRDLGKVFNGRQVESMVREHADGKKNYIYEIDKLLTLILARNTLFRGGSYESDQIELIPQKSPAGLRFQARPQKVATVP